MLLIAETAVSGTAYSFDMLFSYGVPCFMENEISCGCRVLVPFGKGNKHRIGIVMRIYEGDTSGLKSVVSLADNEPVLSGELLELAFYLRDHTFCTYFDAVKAMLPPAMSISVREKFSLPAKTSEYH